MKVWCVCYDIWYDSVTKFCNDMKIASFAFRQICQTLHKTIQSRSRYLGVSDFTLRSYAMFSFPFVLFDVPFLTDYVTLYWSAMVIWIDS